ncbi:hypothetical protein AB9T89_08175 [Flavobacterium oncorhynchi]|uniref:hypothetical protein n=1 Tax=Flavobacterium oncorhynchi TaxID=728056 RepID=UPI003519ECE1
MSLLLTPVIFYIRNHYKSFFTANMIDFVFWNICRNNKSFGIFEFLAVLSCAYFSNITFYKHTNMTLS